MFQLWGSLIWWAEALFFHGISAWFPTISWSPWLKGVTSTGCCLQGCVPGSDKIKTCFHPWCSRGTFPLDAGALSWALPSTHSLCPREEGLLFTKNWWNDVKDWQKQRRKILNYLTLLIAAVVFIPWGWTRAILQSGSKSHIEIPQWILAISNVSIETQDTTTVIKRDMPEMISLFQKLMSLLGEYTIISSCRSLQPACSINCCSWALVCSVAYCRAWAHVVSILDSILQSPGWCPWGCQLWYELCCSLPRPLHAPA